MFVRSPRLPLMWLAAFSCVSLTVTSQTQTPPATGKPPANSAHPPQMPPAVAKAAQQFGKAAQLHKAGKYAQAIPEYEKFLKLAEAAKLPPANVLPAYQNLAILYQTTNNRKGLEATLRQIVRIDPKNVGALAELATMAADEGRFDDARTYGKRALALKPSAKLAAPAHFALGNAAAHSRDYATAEAEYAQVTRLMPTNAQAYYNYGLALSQRGKFKPALTAIDKADALGLKLPQVRLLRAGLKQQLRDYKGALAIYNSLLKAEPRNPVALANRAVTLHAMGQTQEAISAYLTALDAAPNNLQAHLNVADLYAGIGNTAAAKYHYAAALKLAPKQPHILYGLAAAEMEEALTLRDPNQRDAGIQLADQHVREAIALDPKNTQEQDRIALLLARAGHFDDARALYRKRLETQPDNVITYYRIAAVYKMQQKWEDVLKTWQQYRARKPEDPVSYQESALTLENEGKYEAAAQEWRLLLARKPDDGNAKLALGDDYRKLKRFDEARVQYKAVLAMDATGKGAGDAAHQSAAIATATTLRMRALSSLAGVAQDQNQRAEAIQWLTQLKGMETEQAARLKQPVKAEAFGTLARLYEQDKNIDAAVKEYREWAQAMPADPTPYTELARLYETSNKPVEAALAYQDAVARSKDEVGARLQLAEFYRRRQQPEKALAEYETLQTRHPNEPRLVSPMAQTYEQLGQDTKALALYDDLLKADPASRSINDHRAILLTRLKRYPEARAIYEKALETHPDDYQTYADLAHVYQLEGKPDAYLAWLKTQFEKNSDRNTLMAAVIDEYQRHKDEEAGWTYVRGVAMKPGAKRSSEEAFAQLLGQRGKQAEALEVYRQIAAQNPKDFSAQKQLAEQVYASGKPDEAIRMATALIAQKDFSNADRQVLRRQLMGWYQTQGKRAEAIAQGQEILKESPNDFTVSMILSQLLTQENRQPEAVNILLNLSKQSTYPPAIRAHILNRVADIYEKQGRKTDAIGEYKEALKIDTENVEAQAALKRLGGM